MSKITSVLALKLPDQFGSCKPITLFQAHSLLTPTLRIFMESYFQLKDFQKEDYEENMKEKNKVHLRGRLLINGILSGDGIR